MLEHTLSLLKLIVKVVENYQGIDVDLLLMGGFLHDIGKVYEFTFDRAVDYTDAGQLLGHLVMEVEMVSKKIAAIPEFPPELALLLKHLLVSHHGAYEFGSPKLPQTVEAVILHSLDDLDGKIQAIQNLPEREAGSKWTAFHRAYGRSFYRATGEKTETEKLAQMREVVIKSEKSLTTKTLGRQSRNPIRNKMFTHQGREVRSSNYPKPSCLRGESVFCLERSNLGAVARKICASRANFKK